VGTLAAAGAIAGPVGAVVGAAIGLVTMGIEALLNSGCGQSCIITSDWANQAESLLQQNVQAYFSIPTPRPYADQQAAIANFNQIWNYLVSQCSNPQLGAAGQSCISDRQEGACKWKTQTTTALGPPGQCYNWFNAFLDPIQNDTNVAPPVSSSPISTGATSAVSSLAASTGLPAWMLAAAGLVVLFLVVNP
jgi:hypothetical protein